MGVFVVIDEPGVASCVAQIACWALIWSSSMNGMVWPAYTGPAANSSNRFMGSEIKRRASIAAGALDRWTTRSALVAQR
jgi:hypothetical protein